MTKRKGKEMLHVFFEAVKDRVKPLDLDEVVRDFQKKFRERIYEKIQQKEKQECLTYVGGEIKVFSETESDFFN